MREPRLDVDVGVAPPTERRSRIRCDYGAEDIQRTMALIAQTHVVALLRCERLSTRRRTKGDVTVVALIRLPLHLRHIKVNGVLRKAFVLNLRRRLVAHLVVTRCTVRLDQFGTLDLIVVAVLARVAIGVTDIAVLAIRVVRGFVVCQPVGRMRHDRLVTALA